MLISACSFTIGFLKNKDLVTDVEAYPYDVAPGIHFYVIKCGLTHEGVKHHQLGEFVES
jgi:secreted Zn-dependent insulinase-like peptidase